MFWKFVLVFYTCVLYVFVRFSVCYFFSNIYTYYHITVNRNDKMYHTKNNRKKNTTATQFPVSHYITIHYNMIIIYCCTLAGTRRHVTYSNVFQTSGRVGENCRFAVRDCRRAHNRTARARHRVQFQLFLSQRD